ncbi:MAG: hypothetical protein H8E40_09610 [Chloroflexi bacterium]|nr:hypothetical protein [Chloroflexota bacterium]MBL7061901.1 hypothetical protein [Dehalococcoidia bacterium]
MSFDTATIEQIQIAKPRDAEEAPVKFEPVIKDAGSPAWRQINDILCTALSEAGFPQPVQTAVSDWHTPLELPVVVAPGIVVGSEEYRERYGGIDLEQYRQQMSPELFKAFVRHIGRIPGTRDLDLGDIVTTPE